MRCAQDARGRCDAFAAQTASGSAIALCSVSCFGAGERLAFGARLFAPGRPAGAVLAVRLMGARAAVRPVPCAGALCTAAGRAKHNALALLVVGFACSRRTRAGCLSGSATACVYGSISSPHRRGLLLALWQACLQRSAWRWSRLNTVCLSVRLSACTDDARLCGLWVACGWLSQTTWFRPLAFASVSRRAFR